MSGALPPVLNGGALRLRRGQNSGRQRYSSALIPGPGGAPRAGASPGPERALHGIAAHVPRVFRITRRETDLVSAQPPIRDGCVIRTGVKCARNHLKGLLERELAF